ncbi:MAG: hypothetical protein M3134_04315 [Actinomycetota bacterium]|nr:hypothetical protein [Actinomycetota bacterium]
MSQDAIRKALAVAVARRDISEDVVDSIAERLSKTAAAAEGIRRLDVCTYGICIDYFVGPDRWRDVLNELINERSVRRIELFPWGILDPDLFQVHVEHQVDELRFG